MTSFVLPFAGSGARRPPDSAELATGFKCGELDRELFNWLHWYTTIQTPFWPVVSMTITNPPVDAQPGAMYVIPSGASGDWAGLGQEIAMWAGDSWAIIPTPNGHGIGLPDGKIFTKVGGVYVEKKSEAFPAGTRMLFQQSNAPTGWTKDTNHDNKALRLVSGSVTAGGSVAFTTAFSSAMATSTETVSGTVGGTSLSVAQMPNHAHTYAGNTGGQSTDHAHSFSASGSTATDGAHVHIVNGTDNIMTYRADNSGNVGADPGKNMLGRAMDASGAHSHGFSVSGATSGASTDHVHGYGGATSAEGGSQAHAHTFTGDGHSHTTNLAVQYVDVIVCQKDA